MIHHAVTSTFRTNSRQLGCWMCRDVARLNTLVATVSKGTMYRLLRRVWVGDMCIQKCGPQVSSYELCGPPVGWSWPALSKLTAPRFVLLSVALQTRSRKNARCQSHSIQFMCIQHNRELLSTSEYGATVRVCIYDVITFQTTIVIFMEMIIQPIPMAATS